MLHVVQNRTFAVIYCRIQRSKMVETPNKIKKVGEDVKNNNSQERKRTPQEVQTIPFPEEFEHVKSYTMGGVKYINANYLPVSGLESRKN